MTTALLHQLSDLLGQDDILSPEGYAIDGIAPQAVVRPADRRGVASVLAWAARSGVALAPRGGGVLAGLGNVPSRLDLAMDLSRLSAVVDYQPADLTVTVEAGITLEALRRELAQGDKLVPLEAPVPERATVGGILAAGCSGPMRHSYGLPRDWLIGISVVGADGVETKAGGRVVKNVTGYDLNKLYTGSLGALGVIVEASFKLAPRPESWDAVAASFPTLEASIGAARSLVSQVYAPQGLQVVNQPAARQLNLEGMGSDQAYVLAFMTGRPRATARKVAESTRLLGEAGATGIETLGETAGRALLQQLADLSWTNATAPRLGLRINLPPSAVANLLTSATLPEDMGVVADAGFGSVQLLRWGDWGTEDGGDSQTIIDEIDSLRAVAAGLGGTLVVEHCPSQVKSTLDVWEGCTGPAELEIMRRIKQKFDPAGILNPGRSVGRL